MRELECDAVLFDLDGVLVDSTACVERHWRQWAAGHGLDADEILRVVHGQRALETIRLVAPHLAAEEEAARLAAGEAVDTDGAVEIEGAAQLVRSLPADVWAIATSGPRNTAITRLMHTGVPEDHRKSASMLRATRETARRDAIAGGPMIRLVAFDLDGTLIRGETVFEVLAQALCHIERIRELERSLAQGREAALRQAQAEMARFCGRLTVTELESHLTSLRLAPGAEEGIQLLEAARRRDGSCHGRLRMRGTVGRRSSRNRSVRRDAPRASSKRHPLPPRGQGAVAPRRDHPSRPTSRRGRGGRRFLDRSTDP